MKGARVAIAATDYPGHVEVYKPPGGIQGACILLPPGRKARHNDWFLHLKRSLLADGWITFEFVHPPNEGESTDEDVERRLSQLTTFTKSRLFARHQNNFSIVGLSLGGQVALRYISLVSHDNIPQPKNAILCSTVVDSPTPICETVKCIKMFYGERDVIIYETDDNLPASIILPQAYSQTSLKHLIATRSQKISCAILSGCGHSLTSNRDAENAHIIEPIITQLKARCL